MKPEEVPPGPIIVDTDVATWLLAGTPQVEPFLPFLADRLLGISFATFGELLAHSYRLSWGTRKREDFKARIRQNFVVLPFDIRIVEIWAPLHKKLSGHLTRGGTNDLWTAATALAQHPVLPVVTNDLSDFQQIAKADQRLLVVHPAASRAGLRRLRRTTPRTP